MTLRSKKSVILCALLSVATLGASVASANDSCIDVWTDRLVDHMQLDNEKDSDADLLARMDWRLESMKKKKYPSATGLRRTGLDIFRYSTEVMSFPAWAPERLRTLYRKMRMSEKAELFANAAQIAAWPELATAKDDLNVSEITSEDASDDEIALAQNAKAQAAVSILKYQPVGKLTTDIVGDSVTAEEILKVAKHLASNNSPNAANTFCPDNKKGRPKFISLGGIEKKVAKDLGLKNRDKKSKKASKKEKKAELDFEQSVIEGSASRS